MSHKIKIVFVNSVINIYVVNHLTHSVICLRVPLIMVSHNLFL